MLCSPQRLRFGQRPRSTFGLLLPFKGPPNSFQWHADVGGVTSSAVVRCDRNTSAAELRALGQGEVRVRSLFLLVGRPSAGLLGIITTSTRRRRGDGRTGWKIPWR